jgi:hypothetical protein
VEEVSRLAKSPKSPFQWIVSGLILLFFVAILVAPMTRNDFGPRASPALQEVRTIGLAMFQYANDHNGLYPSGKSSTEVFQKLMDENYVIDSAIFYDDSLKVPGKTKPTSKKLKPENICWDITVPVDTNSPDTLPLVFSTGYRIEYVSNGKAVPLVKLTWFGRSGLAVTYHSNSTQYIRDDGLSDGVVTKVISSDFDPAGKTYTQLTPDGPLSP